MRVILSALLASLVIFLPNIVSAKCSKYLEFTEPPPNGKVLLERKSILYVDEYAKNSENRVRTIWYKTPGDNVPIEGTESFKDIKRALQCED